MTLFVEVVRNDGTVRDRVPIRVGRTETFGIDVTLADGTVLGRYDTMDVPGLVEPEGRPLFDFDDELGPDTDHQDDSGSECEVEGAEAIEGGQDLVDSDSSTMDVRDFVFDDYVEGKCGRMCHELCFGEDTEAVTKSIVDLLKAGGNVMITPD